MSSVKESIKKRLPFVATAIRNGKINKYSNRLIRSYKRNWINSKTDENKIGYKILLEVHALEKGMTSPNPRYFGTQKIRNIIEYLDIYEKNGWRHDYAFDMGCGILIEYVRFYEEHGWNERPEYEEVKKYINSNGLTVGIGGTKVVLRKEMVADGAIDYEKFLKSRHSVRSYANKKMSESDIRRAVKMAILTPTACNRQMCKIYNISSDSIRESIYKYAHGLTNFKKGYIGMFVVTYDVSALCNESEICQGYLNSGLVSMNFVNALHSLGIGSCFLEYETRTMKSVK